MGCRRKQHILLPLGCHFDYYDAAHNHIVNHDLDGRVYDDNSAFNHDVDDRIYVDAVNYDHNPRFNHDNVYDHHDYHCDLLFNSVKDPYARR